MERWNWIPVFFIQLCNFISGVSDHHRLQQKHSGVSNPSSDHWPRRNVGVQGLDQRRPRLPQVQRHHQRLVWKDGEWHKITLLILWVLHRDGDVISGSFILFCWHPEPPAPTSAPKLMEKRSKQLIVMPMVSYRGDGPITSTKLLYKPVDNGDSWSSIIGKAKIFSLDQCLSAKTNININEKNKNRKSFSWFHLTFLCLYFSLQWKGAHYIDEPEAFDTVSCTCPAESIWRGRRGRTRARRHHGNRLSW